MKHMKLAALTLGAVLLAMPVLGMAQDNTTPPANDDQTTTQPMGKRDRASPARRLAWMSKKLNLTDDQKAKLQPILQEQFQQMKAVREDTSLTRAQKRDKMMQIRQTYHPQVMAVLTPDQQQKLQQMRENWRARRGKGVPPAAPGSSAPQPQ